MLLIITGVGRSGTTLLTMMLNSHSSLSIPYESNFFVDLYMRRHDFGNLEKSENRLKLAKALLGQFRVKLWEHQLTLEDLNTEQCDSIANAINELYRAYAKKDGKNLWGDKTPGYVDQVDKLWELFPEVKIIHLYRDGRDVALSQLATGWWSISDLMTSLIQWQKKVLTARRMLREKECHRWIEIKYETFVANPEPVLRQICDFLEIEFEKTMLSSYSEVASQKLAKSSITQEHKNLMQAPTTKRCYKWKEQLSDIDQALAYRYAGSLLTELGYETGTMDVNSVLMSVKRLYHHSVNWKYRLRRFPYRLLNIKRKHLYRKN